MENRTTVSCEYAACKVFDVEGFIESSRKTRKTIDKLFVRNYV